MRRDGIAAAISLGAAIALTAIALGACDAKAQGRQSLNTQAYPTTASLSTQAALALYVDPTGSDSNACTATGASACLTIQGAVNKIPQGINYPVKVFPATGTYGGADLSGFLTKVAADKTQGSYLQIEGTYPNATVATGTATGTASAGSAGSGITFGTLTDGTQTWTANDLRGKYLERTGGTGSGDRQLIDGNTATVITIVGTWSAPDATTTYKIEDLGVTINTATDLEVRQATTAIVADTLAKSTNGGAAIYIAGGSQVHLGGFAPGAIVNPPDVVIRGVKIASSAGSGLWANGPLNVACVWCQFSTVNGTSDTRVRFTGGASGTIAYSWFNNDGANNTRQVEAVDPPTTELALVNVLATGTLGRFARLQGSWRWDSIHFLMNGRAEDSGNYRYQFGRISNSIFAPTPGGSTLFALNNFERSHLILDTVSISNPTGAVLAADGNASTVRVRSVTGSGSGGPIWQVTSGAQIQIDAASSCTGTTELVVGSTVFTLAQMRAATPPQVSTDYDGRLFQ